MYPKSVRAQLSSRRDRWPHALLSVPTVDALESVQSFESFEASKQEAGPQFEIQRIAARRICPTPQHRTRPIRSAH